MDKIHKSWDGLFDNYLFGLDDLYCPNSIVYPNKDDVFNAFCLSVDEIKIVLLGQDCYHDGSANGFSFSCNTKIPPSLRNIFKEIKQEFPDRKYDFNHGNINSWAHREKVFLLNCALTVEKSRALSHMDIWSDFTDDVIKYLDSKNSHCIYVLLGNYAKSKKHLIKHKENIIEGVHPSPLSANSGFFGSDIFKNIELKLGSKVDWNL